MPTAQEIRAEVAKETERRTRLAVPTFAGGVLYLLGTIIVANTLKGAPSVGLLEGLGPALSGVANPAVSPRAAEVKFISHHAFPLIAGSALTAAAVLILMLVLLLLVDATRFRRPESWSAGRPLVICGGVALAFVSVGHQVASAIETHNFAVGHDYSIHAADLALTKGTVNTIFDYLDLLAGLAFAAGMIAAMVNSRRVGLLPRWMSILGMFTALLIFLPLGGAELEVIPSFWMLMIGILFVGKWPSGDPPAWAAGEARPWPSAAETRAAKQGGAPQPALSAAGGEVAPAAAPPVVGGTSRKRRRKRGGGR